MLRFKLLPIPRKLLFQLVASRLCRGYQPVFVFEIRDQGLGNADVVAPENVCHVARTETVETQRLERMASRQESGFKRLALDDLDAARFEFDACRPCSPSAWQRQRASRKNQRRSGGGSSRAERSAASRTVSWKAACALAASPVIRKQKR